MSRKSQIQCKHSKHTYELTEGYEKTDTSLTIHYLIVRNHPSVLWCWCLGNTAEIQLMENLTHLELNSRNLGWWIKIGSSSSHSSRHCKRISNRLCIIITTFYCACYLRTWTVCPYITKVPFNNIHVPPLIITKATKTRPIINVN